MCKYKEKGGGEGGGDKMIWYPHLKLGIYIAN